MPYAIVTEELQDKAVERIAEIDRMFDEATGWGSWMVSCANEREDLVDRLRIAGVLIEHKRLARSSDGSRVD